jgi:hypothetical protein
MFRAQSIFKRNDMNYTILLYESPSSFALRSDPEKQEAYKARWPLYIQTLVDAGVLVGGAGLQLPDTATTLLMRDGKRQVQDGPFADTKEQLGGFFIINVPDLDTALEWAARCPVEPDDVLEVRPHLPMPA